MFKKIALFSLVFALCLIVFSSYVRLSGASIACPDWPLCYGELLLSSDADFENQAKTAFPTTTLNLTLASAELSYRYFVGFFIVSLFVLFGFSWKTEFRRITAVLGSVGLLALTGFQAFLASLVVSSAALPIFVTGHLVLGFIIFWLIFWLYLRTIDTVEPLEEPYDGLKDLVGLGLLFVFIQIIIGSWVSRYSAGSICNDLLFCQDQWLPKAISDPQILVNVINEFVISESNKVSDNAKIAIHWLHQASSIVSLFFLLIIVFVSSLLDYPKPIKRSAFALFALLILQMGLGATHVILALPLWSTIIHNLMAALLVLPLLTLSFYTKYSTEIKPVEEPVNENEESDIQSLLAESFVVTMPSRDKKVKKPKNKQQTSTALYQRLKTQLKKTSSGLGEVLSSVSLLQKTIDDELLEEIENSLIIADVGFESASDIIEHLTEKVAHNQLKDVETLNNELKQQLINIVEPCSETLQIPKQDTPFVILVVGVNGAGKTTTIGKLAKRFKSQGHSVMLAAGDTFRAAAVEQLETWGKRNDIPVVAQSTGSDSASVIYDAVESATAKNIDVLIADTAGRLHNKSHLMDELAKVKRVMGKINDEAPHEVLLVLDGGTGQNALSQAENFNNTVPLTGLVITKLDGTAKGGIIFALANRFGIPIRFIGVGEGIDDLQEFHATSFVDALLEQD